MSKNLKKEPDVKWGYSESFFVAFEILVLGFIVEIFLKGRGVKPPHFPSNLYLILILLIGLVVVHLRYRHTSLIKWLSSIPCSVSAISVYALLVLLLGFIPQQENGAGWLLISGLNHINSSWPFLFIQFYLLISLGLVVLRRGIPFKVKNLGFTESHGIMDHPGGSRTGIRRPEARYRRSERRTDFINDGIMADQSRFEMPFDMKLIDFNIELYNPKIAVADRSLGELVRKAR
jgi:hypothetical protein